MAVTIPVLFKYRTLGLLMILIYTWVSEVEDFMAMDYTDKV